MTVFICDSCPSRFQSRFVFLRHLDRRHGLGDDEERPHCDDCEGSFVLPFDKSKFFHHFASVHSRDWAAALRARAAVRLRLRQRKEMSSIRLCCDICGDKFQERSGNYKHWCHYHAPLLPATRKAEAKDCRCDSCESDVWITKSNMFQHHLGVHADLSRPGWRALKEALEATRSLNQIHCDECDAVYAVKNYLFLHFCAKHSGAHSGALEQLLAELRRRRRLVTFIFICDTCQMSVKRRRSLLNHFKKHA